MNGLIGRTQFLPLGADLLLQSNRGFDFNLLNVCFQGRLPLPVLTIYLNQILVLTCMRLASRRTISLPNSSSAGFGSGESQNRSHEVPRAPPRSGATASSPLYSKLALPMIGRVYSFIQVALLLIQYSNDSSPNARLSPAFFARVTLRHLPTPVAFLASSTPLAAPLSLAFFFVFRGGLFRHW